MAFGEDFPSFSVLTITPLNSYPQQLGWRRRSQGGRPSPVFSPDVLGQDMFHSTSGSVWRLHSEWQILHPWTGSRSVQSRTEDPQQGQFPWSPEGSLGLLLPPEVHNQRRWLAMFAWISNLNTINPTMTICPKTQHA